MTASWLRVVGFLLGLGGLAAIAWRRDQLVGRGEALAAIALLGLCILAIDPNLADALPALTGFTGELARVTSLLAFAVLGLGILVLVLSHQVRALRLAVDHAAVETIVDRAMPKLPATMRDAVDLVLVMPAYDEAANLRTFLPQAPRDVDGLAVHIIVVDDGSRDDTSAVAQDHGAWAIRCPDNRGGGFALKVGFAAARRLQATYVITLDADGQHRFADLPAVLAPLRSGTADLVIGSRRLGTAVAGSRLRSLGVTVFSGVLSLLTRQTITDCASGMRGIHLARLADLRLTQARHHTAELIIEAARRRLKIREVGITIVPRLSGTSKKGGSVGYALRFASTIVMTWWRR